MSSEPQEMTDVLGPKVRKNLLERSVARSEKAAAANRALATPGTGDYSSSGDLTHHLVGLKHGEHAKIELQSGGQYTIHYHSRPSYGDNNQPVSGATVGEYTVEHPNGMVTEHAHGPHANTVAARKAGANPHAKGYGAEEAVAAIRRSASGGGVFNDRRH